MAEPMPAPVDKASLRREMRRIRRAISDPAVRSGRIWEHVVALAEVEAAERIVVFTSIPGEPDTASFRAWAEARGVEVRVPEDDVAATWPDVVIVPGVAFTADGHRLGQGGGWYDRFLSAIGPTCVTVGVGFAEQILPALPVEPHDVGVDIVITDAGPAAGPPGPTAAT